MLKLDNLLIELGDFTLAANFTLQRGRKYALIGPSGAGKSTLLGSLCGFVPLASGRLWAGDQDITRNPPGARPLTMLFQDNNLFPHLSVAQNVGLGLRPDLRLSKLEKQSVQTALDRVGLGGFGARKPGTLSGGQQSRAALARVLVQARPWVLLDEPFAALGPALRSEMLDLLQSLVADTGAGMIMVTHSPDDVRALADEVIFIEGNTAQPPQPAAEMMASPPPALRAYLGIDS